MILLTKVFWNLFWNWLCSMGSIPTCDCEYICRPRCM